MSAIPAACRASLIYGLKPNSKPSQANDKLRKCHSRDSICLNRQVTIRPWGPILASVRWSVRGNVTMNLEFGQPTLESGSRAVQKRVQLQQCHGVHSRLQEAVQRTRTELTHSHVVLKGLHWRWDSAGFNGLQSAPLRAAGIVHLSGIVNLSFCGHIQLKHTVIHVYFGVILSSKQSSVP